MIITNIINKDNLVAKVFLVGCFFLGLTGCEAALDLSGVAQESSKERLRTDHYQQFARSGDALLLVGGSGVILRSVDEAQSWQRQEIEGQPNFIGLSVCPNDQLLALSFDRRLWVSGDHGVSWQSQALPSQEDLVGLNCAPDGRWWVTGSFSTILSSADQGQSWHEQSLDEDALLTHVEFFSPSVGIAAAEFGLFFKTTDGGRQWQMIGTIGQELYPLAVYFSDEQTGWVGGLKGVIMQTTDGGQSWQEQPSGIESPIYSFFGSADELYASGDHGKVLSYQGGQWSLVQTPNIPIYLSTGQVLQDNQLLVAGGWGTLLKLSPTLAQL